MKAKPQVYEAFRKRAELLTEAQAKGSGALERVLKMLHVADMEAAKVHKLAGDPLAEATHKAGLSQTSLFGN